jgi:hypothetical protein
VGVKLQIFPFMLCWISKIYIFEEFNHSNMKKDIYTYIWTYFPPIYLYLIFLNLYFMKLIFELDSLTWFFFSNLIFTACVACKNEVPNRKKIKFKNQVRRIKLVYALFFNWIFFCTVNSIEKIAFSQRFSELLDIWQIASKSLIDLTCKKIVHIFIRKLSLLITVLFRFKQVQGVLY